MAAASNSDGRHSEHRSETSTSGPIRAVELFSEAEIRRCDDHGALLARGGEMEQQLSDGRQLAQCLRL